ncbi:hydroxyacid dehydrogenase [Bordetella genomosp. 8]|uniref:Hydroxyacid dehydrogenase n=1 Tax=Bordetella genomosp. 8 TaxID=1416806 RepID=A0A1W6YLI6_9BORD|nr:FAD-binding oxidoreductase [Bordetella genomosp. 8]ARP81960.1 hydroxyacid dehydrogenase [Bordetella genomosp. 8]
MAEQPSSLLAALAAVVGDAHVLTTAADTAPFVAEWRGHYPGIARAVVRPADTGQVAAVVRLCAQAGVPLVPQGGNTGLVGGSTPDESGSEIVISLGRMAAVRNVDPAGNSMTLEAGCTILAAQQAAAEYRRLFPLSLASEGSATIGGALSTNAGGEQVLRYGNTRDLALGLEVVLADGRVLDALTTLRKDNTGYDLKQLFIGAEGTLGIVTAAAFKLYAMPRQTVTGWVALPGPQAAVDLLAMLTDAVGERVTAFELLGREALDQVLAHATAGMRDPLEGGYPWAVLFDVSETSAALDPTGPVEDVLARALEQGLATDAALAASGRQAQEFWALREHVPEAQRLHGPSIKHDISVPVTAIPAFIDAADAALRDAVPGIRIVCFGHVGDGNLHYNQSKPAGMADAAFRARAPEIHDIVHGIAARMNGSISAEHGIGRLKQDAFLRHKSPVAVDLMARVKAALDPQGLFNPGRVLPATRQA